MPLIVAEDLVKEFSRPAPVSGRFSGTRRLFARKSLTSRAVDGVSLSVDQGEVVAYLGPNGAGKSTTIKMLTGILVPSSGRVEVNGIVPWKQRKANAMMIGAVFGQRTQLWHDLPLRDSFDILSKLYGVGRGDYSRRLAEFVELLDLGSFIDQPVRTLSLGQRMRGDLVAAMIHEPLVLYLDEPTVGLDVVAKLRIREFLRHRNEAAGTTIMLTTHDISDVEELCSRAVVIDEGKVLFDGGLLDLRRRYRPFRELSVVFTGSAGSLANLEGIDRVRLAGQVMDVRYDPTRIATSRVISEVSDAVAVEELTVKEPGLEEVIHDIYTRQSGRAPAGN